MPSSRAASLVGVRPSVVLIGRLLALVRLPDAPDLAIIPAGSGNGWQSLRRRPGLGTPRHAAGAGSTDGAPRSGPRDPSLTLDRQTQAGRIPNIPAIDSRASSARARRAPLGP